MPIPGGCLNKLSLILVLLFVAVLVQARHEEWQWALQIAGDIEYVREHGIVSDADGNCYVTGAFSGTAIFGNSTIRTNGNSDIFIAKLDSNGNWLWARQAGGTGGDSGNAIAIDSNGNSYITGFFQFDAAFGESILNGGFRESIYIVKLDADSNWQWANRLGGAEQGEGYAIATDPEGSCYVTGYFGGTGSFGGTILSATSPADTFVAKMDTNGNVLWAKQAKGTLQNTGYSICADEQGNSYITGYFAGSCKFGSDTITASSYADVYMAKLDKDGYWRWAADTNGFGISFGNAVTTDAVGNCFVTGGLNGTAVWSNITLDSEDIPNLFVAKLGNNEGGNNGSVPVVNVTLHGNYPNPFSTQTAIKYELIEPAPIRIDIYNLKGQLVNTIVNESKTAGAYFTIWNGTDRKNLKVANGVYYYTLSSNKLKHTRKMIVLK